MNFSENYLLENDWLRVEPLSKDHLEPLTPISVNQPDLLQFSPSPFGSEELLKEYIDVALEAKSKQQRYPFAIFDKKTNRHVGSTSYGNISVKDQRLEIGWTWISRECQGTGLNRACKFLMLSHAFEQLNMLRVEFKIDSRNVRSRKAVEKIGGQFEGELRSHTLMRDGYRRNTVLYSILKEEWKTLKKDVFGNLN